MTNDERMTNYRKPKGGKPLADSESRVLWTFVLRNSFDIRHSTFVIQTFVIGHSSVPGKNPVGLLEHLLRADVVPDAGYGPGINGRARIEPLHQPAGLVGIVALGDVLPDHRHYLPRIIIEGNPGQRAGGILGLFLEDGDAAVAVQRDGMVVPAPFDVVDIVNGYHGRMLFPPQRP